MPEPSVSPIAIYQLRVVLRGVSPLIWRRLLVVSETSLGELHEILQSGFGWSGEHLHRFLIHGVAYGIPHVGGIVFREDGRGVPLSRFRLHCGERFRYEYDFTADWKLDIRLEGVLPFDSKRALPSSIDGRRAAPAEDCAGAWDYLKRLHWHKSHLPIDEILIMVEAVRRILDSDGDLHAIGDLDELREAADRVKAYQGGRWPKIVRCGDDLQDSSRYRQRRRSQRDTRDHLYPTDRCEAGDLGPNLGRGQIDIERPAKGCRRISGVELAVA